MKYSSLLFATLSLGAAFAHAEEKKYEPPVPVVPGVAQPPATRETFDYTQRLYAAEGSLVAPDKARQVVDAFRAAYEKMGRPRMMIYVNRELVDEHSGLKLSGRSEKTESTRTESRSSFEADGNAPKPEAATGAPQTQVNVAVGGGSAGGTGSSTTPGRGSGETRADKMTAENTYSGGGARTAPALADRQTVRDVERLLGRPFRYAGVTLADQRVASALLADKPMDHFTAPTNDVARKDREALAKIADVVVEVLISSRALTMPEVSGDKTISVPDIQVTAIKLSDSAVIGQASASDVLGKDRQAGRVVSQYDVRDITEATALALMEDIVVTTK